MGRIKASDIPAPLLYAFVDALEAWVLLEHELFMIWQWLSGSPDINKAWETFSSYSTRDQRKKATKLAEGFLLKTQFAPSMPDVFSRLKELAGTRDRIVHGYWRAIHSGKSGIAGYVRIYDARGTQARPVDEEDEQRMLGVSRFYESDLRRAEQQFRDAARDLHHVETAMIISGHKLR